MWLVIWSWKSQRETEVVEVENFSYGEIIGVWQNTATIKTQVHGKETRYNTGRQESRVGKESGEEDNVSQERETNVVLWYGASLQD